MLKNPKSVPLQNVTIKITNLHIIIIGIGFSESVTLSNNSFISPLIIGKGLGEFYSLPTRIPIYKHWWDFIEKYSTKVTKNIMSLYICVDMVRYKRPSLMGLSG